MSSQTWHGSVRRHIAVGNESCLQDALENASDPDVRDLILTYVATGPDHYIDRLTEWLDDRPEPHAEPEERTFILLEYFLYVRKAADHSVPHSEDQLRQELETAEEGVQLSQALGAPACEGRFQAFRGRILWRLEEYDQALNALGAAIASYQQDPASDEPELLLNQGRLHVLRGSILGDRDRLGPALEAFQEALSVLEGVEEEDACYYRAVTLVDRANVLRRLNKHSRAEADLDTALELFRDLIGESLTQRTPTDQHSHSESQPHERSKGEKSQSDERPGEANFRTERADALSIRAAVRADQGKLSPAESDLDRALEIYEILEDNASDPDRAKTFASRGNVRRQTGRLWDAKADYDTAIQVYEELNAALHRRDRAIVRSNRADVRAELGDLRGAESDCNQALRLLRESDEEAGRASRIDALLTRGIVREERGNWPGAEADFNAALELLGDSPWAEDRASETGKDVQADRRVEQWSPREEADRADRALLYLNRGTVRVRRGRQQEAKADFNRALSLYRDDLGEVHDQDRALALINRSDLYREEGDLEAAEDDLSRAITFLGRQGEEGTREARAFALSARGSLRHEQGELESAEQDCTASLQIYSELEEKLSEPSGQDEAATGKNSDNHNVGVGTPYLSDRAAILMHRGIVRWDLGDLEGARADYDAALDLVEEEKPQRFKTDRTLIHLNRGLLFLENGDVKEARDSLSRAADLTETARAEHDQLGDREQVQAEFARVFRRLVDAHLRLYQRTGERVHLRRAWYAAERGRGRRLLDQFGSDGLRLETETEDETVEELRRVRQEIRDLTARFRRDQHSDSSYASETGAVITAEKAGTAAEVSPSRTYRRRSRAYQGPTDLKSESIRRRKSKDAQKRPVSRQFVSRWSEGNEISPFASQEDREKARKRLDDLIDREKALNRSLLRAFGADVMDVPPPEELGEDLRALTGEKGGLLVQWVELGTALPQDDEAPERFALFLLPIGEVSNTGKDASQESEDSLPLQARLISVPSGEPDRWRSAVNRMEKKLDRAGESELPESARSEALVQARSELSQLLGAVGKHLASPLVEAIREEVGGPLADGEGRDPILMVPDGVLSMLPLHAARLSDGEPLFTMYPVTYLGSVATARRLTRLADARHGGSGEAFQASETSGRSEKTRTENAPEPPCISIFGPPSGEGLGEAMEETERVQDLWEETDSQVFTYAMEEMTVDAFAKHSEDMTLASLHTHSEFQAGRNYPNSQIKFYDGGLRLGQIVTDRRFEFPCLRFARLSSCQSARFSWQGGKLRGLVWAFMQAGAGAVEGTLWRVPDESACKYGCAVHGALREGKSIAGAHCQALRQMYREHPEDLFAWASFALYGNGNQRVI